MQSLLETPVDSNTEPDPPRPPILDERHRAELYASGLTDATIKAARIYSAPSVEVRSILRWQPKDRDWDRAMVFPFCGPDGRDSNYARVKLDHPRGDERGRVFKYESPLRMPNRCYFPPNFAECFARTGIIVIVEGEKKALALSQLGIACIGLVGVWGWQAKRQKSDTGRTFGQRTVNPDLQGIKWKSREVFIVFDSDAATNSQIQLAESRLAETLEKLGAVVRVARLPAAGESKVGADDYIVANGEDAIRRILAESEPAETPPPPSTVDSAKMFVAEFFTSEDGIELAWYRDKFYRWVGTHWVEVPESELFAIVLGWLDEISPIHVAYDRLRNPGCIPERGNILVEWRVKPGWCCFYLR